MTRFETTNSRGSPRLLTPPREEEEIYPYRRVWPSLIIETALLFAVAAGFYVAGGYLGLAVPESLRLYANLAITLTPVGLWLVFSRWRENFALEPRSQLGSVLVISALAANAIAIPLLNWLNPEQWLSGAETVNRWIGYTVTVGVSHEIIKYAVLRYLIWPDALRTRADAIAYGVTSALGYAMVFNLHYIAEGAIASDVVATQIFAVVAQQVAASVIVAYGLGEVRFNPRSLVVLPLTLIAAAIIHGIITPTRAGLLRAPFVLGIAGTRPILALLLPALVVGVVVVIMIFLFNVAERREEAAIASREL